MQSLPWAPGSLFSHVVLAVSPSPNQILTAGGQQLPFVTRVELLGCRHPRILMCLLTFQMFGCHLPSVSSEHVERLEEGAEVTGEGSPPLDKGRETLSFGQVFSGLPVPW